MTEERLSTHPTRQVEAADPVRFPEWIDWVLEPAARATGQHPCPLCTGWS